MESNEAVILALFFTSVIVRMLPSLISVNLSIRGQFIVEEVFPTAIFISFITYIVMSEASFELTGSLFAFSAVLVLTVIMNSGLMLTTVVASVIYYALS
ncbi:MAG: hypothetical protein ACI9W6_000086 [Motiliproteus sp.]|jgi:hypothetical protein